MDIVERGVIEDGAANVPIEIVSRSSLAIRNHSSKLVASNVIVIDEYVKMNAV